MQALAFQVGADQVALDVRAVVEVVPRVRLRQPAGGPPWLAGLFVYRGQVVPVLDLFRLVGAGECPADLSSRIILVNAPGGAPDRYLGLLAAGVADLRSVPDVRPPVDLAQPGRPSLGPLLADGSDVLRLLDLSGLVPGELGRLALAAAEADR